ncbi:MAG: hypothetical protein ACR2LC_01170 [Pyrinomonadaceae bacterium]
MPEDSVIIRGGSVTIDNSSKFTDEPNGGRKKSKNKDATLKEIRVNGTKVRDLTATDTVEVVYSEP